jgi:ribosomal protein S18 acetylase RimI-like enzyme
MVQQHNATKDAQVRPARPEDIPRLVELLNALFAQEADFQPDRARQARGLALILNHPGHGRLLVLEQEGEVFGMVNLLLSISTVEGGWVATLEDFVLDPARRGCGHGQRLMDAALALLREIGCTRITLLSDLDNHRGRHFYERNGFVPSAMGPMRRRLD